MLLSTILSAGLAAYALAKPMPNSFPKRQDTGAPAQVAPQGVANSPLPQTIMQAGWRNVTLGAMWPDGTPGPSELWANGLRELCQADIMCSRDPSTPVETKVRIEDPVHPGRWVLATLKVSVVVDDADFASKEVRDVMIGIIGEMGRALSWWGDEQYATVDSQNRGAGDAVVEHVNMKTDSFVSTPEMLIVQNNMVGQVGVANKLQAHLKLELQDNGMDLVCDVIDKALGPLGDVVGTALPQSDAAMAIIGQIVSGGCWQK